MKKAVFTVLLVVLSLMASVHIMAAGSRQESTAGTGELETVIFVVPRSLECLDDMALWSADHLGYFKEEGIKFQMEQAFGTTDIRMIATGQADFGYPSPNLILSSIQERLPVKAVCAADAINIFGMAVRADSGIRTWSDLKGKTIALGDAAWATIAAPTVSAAGLNPNTDVQYIVAGDSRYQMVNEKKIDVLFTWISEYEQLKGQGFDFIYLDGNDILPVLSNPIITSDKVISQKPDLVKRFNRAFTKGLYFVLCNPEAGADIVLNKFPAIQITWEGALGVAHGRNLQAFGTNEATKKEILSAGIGYMAPAKWDSVIQWAQKVGVINNSIPGNQVFSNDYLDFTWNRAAVEADAKAYQYTSRVYKSR
jgi:ABC-type nitrate/sulfonate/bicarbonate transport system substrate-binding protein